MIRLKDNYKAGDPIAIVSADQLNTMARWLNSLTVNNGMRTADPYKLTLYGGGGDAENYPWRGFTISSGTIRVTKGRYTRNADMGNTALTLDCGANEYRDATVGVDEYLSAVIVRDNLDKDPRLLPTSVTLVNSTTTDKAAIVMAVGDKKYGGHVVLGKNTGGVWEQYWKGGNITDALEVNDGDSVNTKTPIIRTLERRPSGDHANENQIMNADAASVDNYNVPYLPKDSSGAGDVTWARIDTHKVSTTSKSLEIASGDLQVKGWATATETAPATGDLILVQRVVSAARDAVYLDVDDLPYLPDDTVIPIVPPTDEPWPTNPDDLSHHALVDLEAEDDHGGVSTAAKGAYVQLIGAATRNKMSGEIGDGSGVQSLDPTARTLDGESTAGEVGWRVTSTTDADSTAADKGALVVAGGITSAKLITSNNISAKTWINCDGTADASDATPSIMTGGGIRAVKKVQAGTNFMCGNEDGITDAGPFILTRSDGTTLNVKLAGGIIVPA